EIAPSTEPGARRHEVEHTGERAVFLSIVQNIDERVAHLPWALEHVCVVAVVPEGSFSSKLAVDTASNADGEPLRAAREIVFAVGCDDQVDVVVLNGKVRDAKNALRDTRSALLSELRQAGMNALEDRLLSKPLSATAHRHEHGCMP